jgi:replicative DNA helicase
VRENPEAERVVLALVIYNEGAFEYLAARAKAEWFSIPEHRLIWEAAEKVFLQTQVVSAISVLDRLTLDGMRKKVADSFPSSNDILWDAYDHPEKYLDILEREFMARQGIAIGQKIVEEFAKRDKPDEVLAASVQMLLELRSGSGPKLRTYSTLEALQVLRNAQLAIARKEEVKGIDPCLPSLKSALRHGVLMPGSVMLVGGSSGLGKTMSGLHIAVVNALKGHRSIYFGTELPLGFIAERIAPMLAKTMQIPGLTSASLVDGSSVSAIEAVIERIVELERSHTLVLVDKASTVQEVELLTQLEQSLRGPFELSVLDYLQMFDTTEEGIRGETEKMLRVSEVLRRQCLANEHVMVAMAAFRKRSGNSPSGDEPDLDAVRSTGKLGYDSSVAIGLWKDSQFKPGRNDVWQGLKYKIVKNSRYPHPSGSKEGQSFRIVVDRETGMIHEQEEAGQIPL